MNLPWNFPHPSPHEIRHVHVIELGPQTLAFLKTLSTSLETKIMAFVDELKAKIADAKQAAADEHTQVLAAIDELKKKLGDVVTDADKAAVFAAVDDLKAGIVDVFTPDATP